MYRTRRARLTGIAYLAPAVLFVLVFTAYPLGQMIWMSFHNWSLINPPRYVGLANYRRAFGDEPFWVSFAFTLKYTAIITPISASRACSGTGCSAPTSAWSTGPCRTWG